MLRNVRATGGGGRPPPRVVVAVLSRATHLSLALLVACAAYTLYALSEWSVEKTRISENALLPGLVDDAFNDASLVALYAKRLRDRAESRKSLISYVDEELRSLRLETYRQNFTTKSTAFFKENSPARTGQNVYGIVRAARSAPLESILLVVRLGGGAQISSAAFALTLASYAKQQIYWARDVIFLFVDGDKLATEAWLSAFHGHAHGVVEGAELEARGGPIIGAFILDISGIDNFKSINVQYGMVNGRLPNLDLVNLFILLVEKYGALPTVYDVAHAKYAADYDQWAALLLFSRAVVSQSFTELEGLHSVIGGYGVNALTLQASSGARGRTPVGGGEPGDDFDASANTALDASHSGGGGAGGALRTLELVRVAEGALRSLNNVLEKFHQSYFLYLLAHTHKFVSVAYYMPIVGMMIAPMLLFALYDWLRIMHGESTLEAIAAAAAPSSNASEANSSGESDNVKVGDETAENAPYDADSKASDETNQSAATSDAFLGAFFGIALTHLISLLFYAFSIALYAQTTATRELLLAAAPLAPNVARDFAAWLSSLANISALVLLLPPLVVSPAAIFVGRVRNDSHYYFLRFFTACEIALFFGALGLVNFALAFSLGVLFIPLAVLVMATGRKSSSFVKLFGFSLLNPVTLAASLCVVLERSEVAVFGGISNFNFDPDTVRGIWMRLVRWVALTARNHFVHNSALFPILAIMCLTIFNALAQILVYERHGGDDGLPLPMCGGDSPKSSSEEKKKLVRKAGK